MILDNLRQIRYRMRAAAERSGRDPESVELVAVTKYAPLESVAELLASGEVAEIGENRVQDAQRRKNALGPSALKARWRMIGHLQTNKAKQALQVFDAIDTIDSEHVAQALDQRLAEVGRTLPALVQVNITGKPTQSGAAPQDVAALLVRLRRLPRLDVAGLMAIAPEVEPANAARPYFKAMKALFDRHFGADAKLSMGMSHDFEVAIEEGSNLIRIGSALFSPDTKETQHHREDSNDR